MSQQGENENIDDVDIMMPEGQGQGAQEDYDHVESTVIKRDERGNVTKQWTEVIKIIRINKKKPFIGGYRKIENDV